MEMFTLVISGYFLTRSRSENITGYFYDFTYGKIIMGVNETRSSRVLAVAPGQPRPGNQSQGPQYKMADETFCLTAMGQDPYGRSQKCLQMTRELNFETCCDRLDPKQFLAALSG